MESGEIGSGEAANPAASIFLAIAGFAARATWVGGLILLCMVVLLWYFQEKLLFYPGVPQGFETPDKNPKGLRSPAERGLPFEELWLRTVDGVKLHCWLIKQKLPQVAAHAPTLIFFHGNAGNVGFRLPNVELLYKHVGVNVLIVSYRGYGFSEGSPTEAGVYRDGEAALDMLVERQNELHIDANKIFLFGRSLGGAVAIDLAVQRPHQVRGVIVENTFTSLLDMVWVVFPLLRPFQRTVRILQRLYMDNGEKIQRLRLPILFISGQKDELVPTRHMKKLFEVRKTVEIISGESEHDTYCRSPLSTTVAAANTWRENTFEILEWWLTRESKLAAAVRPTPSVCAWSSGIALNSHDFVVNLMSIST